MPALTQADAAVAALRERRWYAAVELYTPLVNSRDLDLRAQARYGLALAYSQLGEDEQAYRVLEGTLRDMSPLGLAVGHLRGQLALQLAERHLAEQGTRQPNPWLQMYARLADQPDRARYERLVAAYDVYQGATASATLRVAVLLPLSGPLAEAGNAVLQGLHLGLEAFDGRRGTAIELVALDTAQTPAATLAAQILAAPPATAADVVVGPLLAPDVTAAAPALTAAGIPLLALSNDRNVMGNGVHALNYLPSAQARLAARTAVRMGHRKLAVLAPTTDYGTEALEAFSDEAQREGATLTGTAFYDPKATDVGASIRQLTGAEGQALPFDGVFVPAPAAAMPLLKAQLNYYGVNSSTLVLGTGLWQNNALLAANSGMRGAVLAAPPKVASFEQLYQASYGREAPSLAVLGYDTARILADLAAERQRTPRPVNELLLRPEGFYGSSGYFRFRPNGHTERGLDVVRIGSQFEVLKPALVLAPVAVPAEVRPAAQRPSRW